MIYGEASAVVTADPSDVLDFVCDVHRYKRADTKIRRVLGVERDGDDVIVRFRSSVRGLPGPATRQRVHRTGDERVDITDMPSWQNRLMTFVGRVTCDILPEGTRVTHREEFRFHGPLRLVAEPLLRGWLAADVADEVTRMGVLLNAADR